DVAVELAVVGLVDGPHAALANLAKNLVSTGELGPDGQARGLLRRGPFAGGTARIVVIVEDREFRAALRAAAEPRGLAGGDAERRLAFGVGALDADDRHGSDLWARESPSGVIIVQRSSPAAAGRDGGPRSAEEASTTRIRGSAEA